MPKRPNKYPAQNAERKREIQLIQIARKQLYMADDSYYAMLWSIARVKSSTELDFAGRKNVLDHMKACGFKVRSTGKASGAANAAPSRALARDPESRKIRALWLLLHDLGAVKNPSETAMAAYVKRLTKVDDLHWINGDQALTLIETLKKWAMRYLPAKVEALSRQCADLLKSGELQLPEDTVCEIASRVRIAQERNTFDPMESAYEALNFALGKVNNG